MSTMTLPADAAPRPRSRFLAALLTFLAPGVGHLYIGQRRRALAIVVIDIALLAGFIAGALVLPPSFAALALYGIAGLGTLLLFALVCVIDAVRLARRDAAAPRVRWYVLIAATVAVWAVNYGIELAAPAARAHTPWRTYTVPSGSMEPTLHIGEWFIGDPRWFAGHAPARGDVVTYRLPSDENTIYVKRVVALAGDRIAFRDNRAVVNGAVQAEPFADLSDPGNFLGTTAEVTVPADHIFVAGDNRANSSDSRVARHGFVPVKNLIARATEVLLSEDVERLGQWIGSPAR